MKTSIQENLQATLPEGFRVRGARFEDVEAIYRLSNAWSRSVAQEDELTNADLLRNEWNARGFDPAKDVRVMIAPNGEIAAYIEVWTIVKPPVHPWLWGRVHPSYENMGIGTWLLQWAEQCAQQGLNELPSDARLAPRTRIYRKAERSKKLLEDMGYVYIRSGYRMLIDMERPVPEPIWPEGITLRSCNPEADAEAVYRADIDAFRDHFGFVEEPFEEGYQRFKHMQMEYEGFDPTLWFLAMDGDEIAGISLCRPHSYEDTEVAWVDTLAVRRPWRKRGIGLALLRHSFNEFYRRGKHKVGLGVDAQNLTGALRLYENAGMKLDQAMDLYEKELRPGTEISVQSLQK